MHISPQRARLTTLAGFISLILVWGSFPIAARIGAEHAPPLLLSAWRFLLAAAFMLCFTLFQRQSLRLSWQQHRQIVGMSTLMVGIPAGIFVVATLYAPVSILTVIWSVTPLFTALFTGRESGEVRGWRLILSLCVGLLGVLIVLLGRLPFQPGAALFAGGGATISAEVAVLISAAVCALGIRAARRSDPKIPVVVLTAWQLFYSGAFLLVASFILEPGQIVPLEPVTLATLFYLVLLCGCFTYLLTFWLIRRIGAIRTSYSDFVTPGVTLLFSALLLGESITPAKIVGLVLVLLGVVLVQR